MRLFHPGREPLLLGLVAALCVVVLAVQGPPHTVRGLAVDTNPQDVSTLTDTMLTLNENINTAGWFGQTFLNDGRLQDLQGAAKERAIAVQSLATTDPDAAADQLTLEGKADKFPPSVQQYIEKPFTYSGRIALIGNHAATDPKEVFGVIVTTEGVTTIHAADLPAGETQVDAQITGAELSGAVIARRSGVVTTKLLERVEPVPATYHLLILNAHYTDTNPSWYSDDAVKKSVERGAIADYLSEVSNGKTSLSVDWRSLTIENPSSKGYWCTGWGDVNTQLKAMNLESYDGIILLTNENCYGPAGWSTVGKVPVGSLTGEQQAGTVSVTLVRLPSFADDILMVNGARPNMKMWESVFLHELGHAFGFFHANSLICGNDEYRLGSCIHQEYGNDFDIMGTGVVSDYELPFRVQAGWVSPSTYAVASASGTYTVVDDDSKPGMLVLQSNAIGQGFEPMYAVLETPKRHRGALKQSGIMILLDGRDSSEIRSTEAIEIHPDLSFTDRFLMAPGDTFTDKLRGFSLTLVSVTDTSATMQVNYVADANPAAVDFGAFEVQTEWGPNGNRLGGWLRWRSASPDCLLEGDRVPGSGEQKVYSDGPRKYTLACPADSPTSTQTVDFALQNNEKLLYGATITNIDDRVLIAVEKSPDASCGGSFRDSPIAFYGGEQTPIGYLNDPNGPHYGELVTITCNDYVNGRPSESLSVPVPVLSYGRVDMQYWDTTAAATVAAGATIPMTCAVNGEYFGETPVINTWVPAHGTYTLVCDSTDAEHPLHITDSESVQNETTAVISEFTATDIGDFTYTLAWQALPSAACTLTVTNANAVLPTGTSTITVTEPQTAVLDCTASDQHETRSLQLAGPPGKLPASQTPQDSPGSADNQNPTPSDAPTQA